MGLLLCALTALGASWAQDLVPIPALHARVTDLTRTLSADQTARLEQKLAAFEARKGSQIAVLIVPSTRPETIEAYSIRVAEQWKLGRKGVDDGALVLVAKDDRALRIEVGYGLEGVLPDAVTKRIIEDTIIPRFKSGDFYGGIDAGVEATMKVVDGEPLPPPEKTQWRSRSKVDGGNLQSLFVLGIILVFVVGGVLRAVLGRLPAAGLVGGVAGGIAWLLLSSLGVAVVAGVIAFVFTLMGGGSRMGRGGFGGWGGGGFGGGGGLSGGGGFSGGGGGFGGGGASGRW
jgi:uncharacterized protein